jgi:hypothetical protein
MSVTEVQIRCQHSHDDRTFTTEPPLLAVVGPADPDGDESGSSHTSNACSAPARTPPPRTTRRGQAVGLDGPARRVLMLKGVDTHPGPNDGLAATLTGFSWTPCATSRSRRCPRPALRSKPR